MYVVMSGLVGVLFAVGLYMMMQKALLRVIIGASLVSHGSLLAILTIGGSGEGLPPVIVDGTSSYTDPVPQALILTAIVIGFGLTAFQLVLAYRTYQETGTDDLSSLRNRKEASHE